MPRNIEELKKQLGCNPDSDENLIKALTHRSYAVENNLDYDNQRLEFLGDAVIEIVLTEYLYDRYPEADEGVLSRLRSALVRESTLANLARHLNFGEYMLLGKGESDSGGSQRESTLADLFEAVMGAIYLDLGSECVHQVLGNIYMEKYPNPMSLLVENNPKGALQELSQEKWSVQPEYTVVEVAGPEHMPTYSVEVKVHDTVAIGRATGRKAAEAAAAQSLLEYFSDLPNK